MVFIETTIFTTAVKRLIDDEEYRALQWLLVRNPEKGVLIPGAAGLRKIRWVSRRKQRGRRGGLRIIYYIQSNDNLYMMFLYDKTEQGDLTRSQLKQLREYVKRGVL